MEKKIKFRHFRTEDTKKVAEIMALSFRSKFNRLTNVSEEKMPDFLIQLGIIYSSAFLGYIVAEENDEVVGVMALKWKNQKRSKSKSNLIKAIKYGIFNIMKMYLGLGLIKSKPKKGECYIEHIAVKSSAQGEGIGSQLLEFGEKYAIENDFEEYTLHVSSLNEGAIKLYDRKGFMVLKTEFSMITNILFGIKKWYYMGRKL
ncbi:MAG: hypothetical protein B6I28_01705 [Fusobacteriia bacterium 4572_132]|nr:MAG: hypothetical protein B6I28_01705 [Fusobacteriia bacterium 4572_132]